MKIKQKVKRSTHRHTKTMTQLSLFKQTCNNQILGTPYQSSRAVPVFRLCLHYHYFLAVTILHEWALKLMIIMHINRKLLAMLIDLCAPGGNTDPTSLL
jgi:hypothetical protein